MPWVSEHYSFNWINNFPIEIIIYKLEIFGLELHHTYWRFVLHNKASNVRHLYIFHQVFEKKTYFHMKVDKIGGSDGKQQTD